MKLVAVVAAAAVSSALAACTIKKDSAGKATTACVEDNCKYVAGSAEIPATKDSFMCTFGPTKECSDGVTKDIAGASSKLTACIAAPKKETSALAACADVKAADGTKYGCQTVQIAFARAKIAKKDAACVPKKCYDYPKEADCKKQSACEFKAKEDGTSDTYKCESLKGNSAAKKTLCEAVKVEKSADAGKCIVTANGGSLCCKVAVTKGKAGSPAMCVDAKKASAGTAVLSAFAAVSAALLM